jgi:metal-sulfur cluster biosynthetic enzyme
MSALRDRVMKGLEEVIDPCSVTAGAPLSVVDMGLINELAVSEDGAVRISMRATSAMCTMIAEERLAAVEGVTCVDVTLCSGAIWTEADMTEHGRQILMARRERSRAEVTVRPHEWKTRLRRPAAASESTSSQA